MIRNYTSQGKSTKPECRNNYFSLSQFQTSGSQSGERLTISEDLWGCHDLQQARRGESAPGSLRLEASEAGEHL